MWLEGRYLRQWQLDKNGVWYKRTIAKFDAPPIFKVPFIYRGSCDDLISSIKDKSINLILTDPPFGITDNKWDVPPDWKKVAVEYDRILADNGQIAIFGTIPNILTIYQGFQELFDFRFDCVWYKGTSTVIGISTNRPMRTHEHIFVFKKKDVDVNEVVFNPKGGLDPVNGIRGDPYVAKKGSGSTNYALKDDDKGIVTVSKRGYRKPESVINTPGIGGFSREYCGFPTQKPEHLMEFFVRGLSRVNDTILDPYLGSGTTAKVAMENCRFCVGSEIDPTSYPILDKRLKSVMSHFDIKWSFTNGFLHFPLKSMTEGWV